jgi:molybdate transport system ATP-binding protein
MSLQIDVRVAERDVDTALEVRDGETLAVIGPNGAGKSTLLSLIGGMLRPSSGRIVLDGAVLTEVQPGQRARLVPPYDRRITTLSQDPVLFPHMTALGNVMFGLRSQGEPGRAARGLAQHWLEQVGALELAERRPAQLSGGQAQRVALARALAVRPHLVLLDEPMAALDIDVAPALREQLRRVLAETTTVIVTHDLLDVASLADRVAVLEVGRLLQLGRTAEVLTRPRSAFAARFAGLNLVRGQWCGDGIAIESAIGSGTDDHLARTDALHVHGGEVLRADPPRSGTRNAEAMGSGEITAGSEVLGAFPPRSVQLQSVNADPRSGDRTMLRRTVRSLEPYGEVVRVRAGELAADITAQQAAELHLQPGTDVILTVRAEDVSVYPAVP